MRYIHDNYATFWDRIFFWKQVSWDCQICSFLFLEDISPFCGTTGTSVLDFWWYLPWVSKPGWIPFWWAYCNRFHRFTFGVTPTQLLMVNIATKPFLIHILAHIQALVGLEPRMKCMAQVWALTVWAIPFWAKLVRFLCTVEIIEP